MHRDGHASLTDTEINRLTDALGERSDAVRSLEFSLHELRDEVHACWQRRCLDNRQREALSLSLRSPAMRRQSSINCRAPAHRCALTPCSISAVTSHAGRAQPVERAASQGPHACLSDAPNSLQSPRASLYRFGSIAESPSPRRSVLLHDAMHAVAPLSDSLREALALEGHIGTPTPVRACSAQSQTDELPRARTSDSESQTARAGHAVAITQTTAPADADAGAAEARLRDMELRMQAVIADAVEKDRAAHQLAVARDHIRQLQTEREQLGGCTHISISRPCHARRGKRGAAGEHRRTRVPACGACPACRAAAAIACRGATGPAAARRRYTGSCACGCGLDAGAGRGPPRRCGGAASTEPA